MKKKSTKKTAKKTGTSSPKKTAKAKSPPATAKKAPRKRTVKKKAAKKLSKAQLTKMVEDKMPGMSVVGIQDTKAHGVQSEVGADAVSPSIRRLQQKYLKGTASADSQPKNLGTPTAYVVEVESSSRDAVGGGRKKILLAEDGTIVGAQG